jgi:hypothetical protein
MTRLGRSLRLLGTGAVLVATVAGSLWGDDDAWPIGPFRMYATTTRLDDTVIVPRFVGVTAEGRRVRLETDDFGLRRAEVLGQLRSLRARPRLLGSLALAHARLHPGAPRLVSLSLVAGVHHLRGGRPVAYEHRVLVTWRARPASPGP